MKHTGRVSPRKNVERERVVRHGNWKLIEPEAGETMLFNLKSDIAETTDVVSRHPEIAAELRQKLDIWENSLVK